MSNIDDQQSKIYQILIGTGLVQGGTEQLILQVIPLLIEDDFVKHVGIQRNGLNQPLLQVYVETSEDHIDTLIEAFEDAMATDMQDDNRLVMSPMVEIATPEDEIVSNIPYGVRCQSIQQQTQDVLSEEWWQVELHSINLVLKVLAQRRYNGIDRKTISPQILYSLLCGLHQGSKLSAQSFRIAQLLLESSDDASNLMNQFRRNVHQLSQKGVCFVSDDIKQGKAPCDIADDITSLQEAAHRLSKDLEPAQVEQRIWLSIANKLGFTQIEAAYVALMVSADCK